LTIKVHNSQPGEYKLNGFAMSSLRGGGQPGLITTTLSFLSIPASALSVAINWYEPHACLVALKVLSSLEFRGVLLGAMCKGVVMLKATTRARMRKKNGQAPLRTNTRRDAFDHLEQWKIFDSLH